jgi:chromosome segregation ATPase
LSNQQAKYGKIIGQLHNDINGLQSEIDRVHEENIRVASLLRDANGREAALRELEDKNDSLQKSLELYENKFLALEQEVGKLQFQNQTLTANLTKLEEEIRDKDKRIVEIRGELQKTTSDYNMMKSTCKCSDTKVGSSDKVRSPVKRPSTAFAESQFNELHRRLSQKSVEASKSMETLKRRSQEFERQKKQALEENKRLVHDATVLVDAVREKNLQFQTRTNLKSFPLQNSELRNKISILELHLEQVKKELERRNEKLRISESRETDRQSEMEHFSQQLEDMRQNEMRLRNRNDILSEEIEKHRQSHSKRDSNTLNELKQAHRTIKEKNVELNQLDENIAGLTETNQILSLEVSFWEN